VFLARRLTVCGSEAPELLRRIADELEWLAAERDAELDGRTRDPSNWAGSGRHGRAHLYLATLAAVLAPHRQRQPALAVTLGDELGERQHAPPIAPRAVGGELVLVLE